MILIRLFPNIPKKYPNKLERPQVNARHAIIVTILSNIYIFFK